MDRVAGVGVVHGIDITRQCGFTTLDDGTGFARIIGRRQLLQGTFASRQCILQTKNMDLRGEWVSGGDFLRDLGTAVRATIIHRIELPLHRRVGTDPLQLIKLGAQGILAVRVVGTLRQQAMMLAPHREDHRDARSRSTMPTNARRSKVGNLRCCPR
ncbi:MAG: hypothetical protein GY747_02950 [Planctomycetes bacterium]|nr:hypothetical protein [Planctomycetota bacterium]